MELQRNIYHKVKHLLNLFPAVVIVGARQTGKTTLVRQIAPDWRYLDMENPDDYARLSYDPMFYFSQNPRHLVIDEAQFYPELFRVLRSVIDSKRNEKGRFLLTGSSSPELLSSVVESLAGRVAIIELSTLKANEFYQQPLSQFYEVFKHPLSKNHVIREKPPLTNTQMHKLWLRGGYPEPILNRNNSFYNQWMQQYRDAYINRDIAKLFPRLNRHAYQQFLLMLSKLSGTIINRSDLARTLEINEKSVREYLKIISGTFIWRDLPSYEKNIIKSIIKMPKGYIRDSGLLHYFLKIASLDELFINPIVGYSFETFVIEELIKGMQALDIVNWDTYYYRTRHGSEIDLILDGTFGTLPIEIKYGSRVDPRQLKSLSAFIDEHHLPFGMIINQSESVEWLTSNIVQIPVGWI